MYTQQEHSQLNNFASDIFKGIKSNKFNRGQKQVDFTRRQQQLIVMFADRETECKRIINASLRTVGIDIKLKSNVDFAKLMGELKEYSKVLAHDAVSCTYTLNKSSLSIKSDISANDLLVKLKAYSEDLHDELVWVTYEPRKQPETAVLLSKLKEISKEVVYNSETSTYTLNNATLSIKFARQSKLLSKINFVDLQELAVKKYTSLVAFVVMIKNSPDPVQTAKDQVILYCPNILLHIVKDDLVKKDTQLMLEELLNKKLQQIFLAVAASWLLSRSGVSELIIAPLLVMFLLYITTQLFVDDKSSTNTHSVTSVSEEDKSYKKFVEYMKYIQEDDAAAGRYDYYKHHYGFEQTPTSRVITIVEPQKIQIKPFSGTEKLMSNGSLFMNKASLNKFEGEQNKRKYEALIQDLNFVARSRRLGLCPAKHHKFDIDVEDCLHAISF